MALGIHYSQCRRRRNSGQTSADSSAWRDKNYDSFVTRDNISVTSKTHALNTTTGRTREQASQLQTMNRR